METEFEFFLLKGEKSTLSVNNEINLSTNLNLKLISFILKQFNREYLPPVITDLTDDKQYQAQQNSLFANFRPFIEAIDAVFYDENQQNRIDNISLFPNCGKMILTWEVLIFEERKPSNSFYKGSLSYTRSGDCGFRLQLKKYENFIKMEG